MVGTYRCADERKDWVVDSGLILFPYRSSI